MEPIIVRNRHGRLLSATVGPVKVRPALNYMEDDTPEGMRREYHVPEMVNFNAFALT